MQQRSMAHTGGDDEKQSLVAARSNSRCNTDIASQQKTAQVGERD